MNAPRPEHYRPRCEADPLHGTGFGVCDQLLDEHGNRPARRLAAPGMSPLPVTCLTNKGARRGRP